MRSLGRAAKAGLIAILSAAALAGGVAVAAAPASTRLDPIAIHGNKTVFEIAPVLLAAERLYPGEATVKMGGIANLYGEPPIPGFGEAGVADIAGHAETQALRYSVRNPDLRIIMTVSEGLYRIVARRSAGITTLAGLRGKRIATIAGTSSGYFLNRMLKSVGLAWSDVTIVPILPLSDMPKALAEGRVDAVTIWEPEIENAVTAIGPDAIEFSGRGVYRELYNLNTTAANLRDPAKREKIVAFVRGVIEASAMIRATPAMGWPLVAKHSGYPEALVAKAWHHHSFPGGSVPDLLDVLVEQEQWLAVQDKRPARSRAQLAMLIDMSVLVEAKARPGKVQSK